MGAEDSDQRAVHPTPSHQQISHEPSCGNKSCSEWLRGARFCQMSNVALNGQLFVFARLE